MSKKTDDLFSRFKAIYGARWTACYTTAEAIELAIFEWSEVIESMTEQQLTQAITWAKTTCPWPPSLAEFLHAGVGIDEDAIERTALGFLSGWDRRRMTTKELDKAVRAGRASALKMLLRDRLRPALDHV